MSRCGDNSLYLWNIKGREPVATHRLEFQKDQLVNTLLEGLWVETAMKLFLLKLKLLKYVLYKPLAFIL